MMRNPAIVVLAFALAGACSHAPLLPPTPQIPASSRLVGADTITRVEYKAGLKGTRINDARGYPLIGRLVIGDTALWIAVQPEWAPQIFIPIRAVRDVSSSVENAGPSVANRILFGALASYSRDEVLLLEIKVGETPDVLIIKMWEKNTSPGAAAKIRYRMQQLQAR